MKKRAFLFIFLLLILIFLILLSVKFNLVGRVIQPKSSGMVTQQDIIVTRSLPDSYIKGEEFIVVLNLQINKKPNALIIKETIPENAYMTSSSPSFQKSEGNTYSLLLSNFTYPVENKQIIYALKINSDTANFDGKWVTSQNEGITGGNNSVKAGTTTRLCIDRDGDGFGIGLCPPDCNDNDAKINMNALENCTDNIDNNCDNLVDMADFYCIMQEQMRCDKDGDGYKSIACGGNDCDDNRGNVNPGREESIGEINCNDGLDNDCDGKIDAADSGCINPCNFNGVCDWNIGENPGNCGDCRT